MIPSCRRTHLCRTQRLAPAIINRSFQRGRTEQAPTKYELVINLKTAKAARFCAGNAARNRQRGDARLRAGALKRGFVRRAISAATVGDQLWQIRISSSAV